MRNRHLPLIGIVTSVCLFAVAGTLYPGGTTDSANTVGYDWTRNFISSLFEPTALNGEPSPARFIAIPAMLMMCASIGALFKSVSNAGPSRAHRKTIEIAGIASMVYAFLVVTRMHNLMINIALPLALIALFATLHMLYAGRRPLLFLSGIVCLALLLVTATMYYEHHLWSLLPIMQKVSLVSCVGWVSAVHYATPTQAIQPGTVPADTAEPTQ